MFARVIIDIKNREVDRPFTYRVPESLEKKAVPGAKVFVPFGKGDTRRSGFVIGLEDDTDLPREKLKEIDSVDERSVNIDEQMIRLAIWLRHRYGGTLYQALSVVMMSRMKVSVRQETVFVFTGTDDQLRDHLYKAEQKKYKARVRLLTAFQENKSIPTSLAYDQLNITKATVKPLIDMGLVKILSVGNPSLGKALNEAVSFSGNDKKPALNSEQESALHRILESEKMVSLLFGITGSGKTEVYLSLIEEALKQGKEAIVLIPEIALTYQTVMRFYERFGDLISVVHSRLSKGEKYERFVKAREGEIRIMIGPRSALFTPFQNLGLIVIDEFHETSYLSETVPKYDTVETAIERASYTNARVVLGSATPSVDAYERALQGEYELCRLTERAVDGSVLPEVKLIDMREELKAKNRSVFSRELRDKIQDRLEKKEQVMLFLNRRGYSGAVSCRTCGKPVTCPHCSLSLSYHRDGTLKCHICGYTVPMVKECPECGSKLIGTFGIGTEKVEELLNETFPEARVLRMDADTTAGKNGHQEILQKFRDREADILVGTQMIVKGHDFKDVTLMGILAADLSLNVPDYRSAERTFQLLVQAEGRAGRDKEKGECIVQTYMPEHYAVSAAVSQDYEAFFEKEMVFRTQMNYPPKGYLLSVTLSGADKDKVKRLTETLCRRVFAKDEHLSFLGPAESPLFKVKDMYRYLFYVKASDLDTLLTVKTKIEKEAEVLLEGQKIYITFEA